MARAKAPVTASLTRILKGSEPPDDAFIVYRGSVAKTAVTGELLLRTHLSPMREWAVFRTRDLVGKPVAVPAAERAPRERGHEIVELRVRRGASFRHVQEWLYRAGTHATPPGIDMHLIGASADERAAVAARATQLVASSLEDAPYAALFHGVIRRGAEKGELVLQPELGSFREWAVVKIADVVNPDALLRVPTELLPRRLHPVPHYFVPLKAGAIVRAMWEKTRTVSLKPDYGPANGISSRPTDDTAIVTQGDCTAAAGTCPPAVATGAGYPCSSAGAFCRAFGIVPCSGTCSTTASAIWTCRCDCC